MSERTPPQHESLQAFESDLYRMARSIKFRRATNAFQTKRAKDKKNITSSSKLYVPADKITNIYKLNVKDYDKLLRDNITAKDRKVSNSTTEHVNQEAKVLAANLKLEDRIQQLAEKKAFIPLKDHKPNFVNQPKCRLINPAKLKLEK